jgi:hypothetical protein
MDGSGLQGEGRGAKASLVSLRVLDTFAILLCVMIVVLIVMAIVNHGSRHEGGPIAAMAASLAAISATRANLARRGPPLDPAVRARQNRLRAIGIVIAVAAAIVTAGAVVVFRLS